MHERLDIQAQFRQNERPFTGVCLGNNLRNLHFLSTTTNIWISSASETLLR